MHHHVISTILRHDSKLTSYKIALLRALNDVVFAYPDLRHSEQDVAIPLRLLAESWVAYYWPFVDPRAPIQQGPRTWRDGVLRNDISFRPHLTELRRQWEGIYGPSSPADGWLLVEQMRVPRTRASYPATLTKVYRATLRQITQALRQPIQYAGPGTWSVFARPKKRLAFHGVITIPGSSANDTCLIVSAELWRAFRDVSLWVEALCIHEWSLFTERVAEGVTRGRAYELLTTRPDNRLPVTWERNQIDLLMQEGARFTCPWTGRPLTRDAYQLDHIVPVALHPFHELWNLVPADPEFNMHTKRDRLPNTGVLQVAMPRMEVTYGNYETAPDLAQALRDDVSLRFSLPEVTPTTITRSVVDLVESLAEARNVARFSG